MQKNCIVIDTRCFKSRRDESILRNENKNNFKTERKRKKEKEREKREGNNLYIKSEQISFFLFFVSAHLSLPCHWMLSVVLARRCWNIFAWRECSLSDFARVSYHTCHVGIFPGKWIFYRWITCRRDINISFSVKYSETARCIRIKPTVFYWSQKGRRVANNVRKRELDNRLHHTRQPDNKTCNAERRLWCLR